MPPTFTLFLQVLPLAIGAAMSPTFLAMQILLLSSGPGSVRKGWALAAGSMSMLLLISFGGFSLLSQLPTVGLGEPSLLTATVLLVAGLAMLGLAYWEKTHPSRETSGEGKARLAHASPTVVFIAGAVRMMTNATTLALYLPALHLITSSNAWIEGKALVFAFLFLLTELAVLGPMIAVTWKGDQARAMLLRLHRFIQAHAHRIMLATCLAFGVALVVAAVWTAVQVL